MKKEKKTVLEMLKEKTASQEFKLPVSGITVVMQFLSVKRTNMAQKIATTGTGENIKVNEELYQAAMIAETCTFNGETLTAEDIKESMNGVDYLFLLGKLMGSDSLIEK